MSSLNLYCLHSEVSASQGAGSVNCDSAGEPSRAGHMVSRLFVRLTRIVRRIPFFSGCTCPCPARDKRTVPLSLIGTGRTAIYLLRKVTSFARLKRSRSFAPHVPSSQRICPILSGNSNAMAVKTSVYESKSALAEKPGRYRSLGAFPWPRRGKGSVPVCRADGTCGLSFFRCGKRMLSVKRNRMPERSAGLPLLFVNKDRSVCRLRGTRDQSLLGKLSP